jgi:putative FmdB family regulatory protein
VIYTYVCKKCEKEEDRLVKMADADNQVCNCGEPMQQKDTYATAVHFKGNWFKTRGRY